MTIFVFVTYQHPLYALSCVSLVVLHKKTLSTLRHWADKARSFLSHVFVVCLFHVQPPGVECQYEEPVAYRGEKLTLQSLKRFFGGSRSQSGGILAIVSFL